MIDVVVKYLIRALIILSFPLFIFVLIFSIACIVVAMIELNIIMAFISFMATVMILALILFFNDNFW